MTVQERSEPCAYKTRDAKDCRPPLEVRRKDARILSWTLQREHGPAHPLTLGFWPPKQCKNTFLLF